jgi:antitoxin component of MazEF toxin-antitoxin module
VIIKKTRREGASTVLVIPQDYCRELKLAPGDYLAVRSDHEANIILTKLETYIERTRRPAPPPTRPRARA